MAKPFTRGGITYPTQYAYRQFLASREGFRSPYARREAQLHAQTAPTEREPFREPPGAREPPSFREFEEAPLRWQVDNQAEGNEPIGTWREWYEDRQSALDAIEELIDHRRGSWESGAVIAIELSWNEDEEQWEVEVEYGEFSP